MDCGKGQSIYQSLSEVSKAQIQSTSRYYFPPFGFVRSLSFSTIRIRFSVYYLQLTRLIRIRSAIFPWFCSPFSHQRTLRSPIANLVYKVSSIQASLTMCIATSKNVSHANGNSNKRDADSQIKDVAMFPKVQRFLPLILSGYMFNTIAYAIVYVVLPFTGLNLTPAQEFCQNHIDNECTRRDLFTFQVVSFINLSYLGLLGFYTFFVSKRAYTALPRTSQGRILGNVSHVSGDGNGVLLPEADYVNIGIIIFQGWDFIASIFFEEHCTLIMMTHHLLAFSCGLFSLEYGVSPFFLMLHF